MTTRDLRADRAMAAMLPFVMRWGFPANPEDIEEIVYAVLLQADSDSSLEEIDIAVRHQIAEYMLRMRRFQLEAYRKLEPVQATVQAVVELLVKRDYETLELAAMTPERRVDLSRAVAEYGRTLTTPDASWWSSVTLTPLDAAAGGGLYVEAPLWSGGGPIRSLRSRHV